MHLQNSKCTAQILAAAALAVDVAAAAAAPTSASVHRLAESASPAAAAPAVPTSAPVHRLAAAPTSLRLSLVLQDLLLLQLQLLLPEYAVEGAQARDHGACNADNTAFYRIKLRG
jgi:hypothetical protein